MSKTIFEIIAIQFSTREPYDCFVFVYNTVTPNHCQHKNFNLFVFFCHNYVELSLFLLSHSLIKCKNYTQKTKILKNLL